jgi:hypothetical protein
VTMTYFNSPSIQYTITAFVAFNGTKADSHSA